MTSNIKIKKINNEVASIIIDEPKTYNSLSFKNLSDLLKALKNLDNPNYQEPADGWEWVTGENFSNEFWAEGEPNEAGSEDCLEVWGFDKVLNDNRCHLDWTGIVVEFEMNGTNHYEALIPQWVWDDKNGTDVLTYVKATPLTDNERNEILKEEGDPDADNDGIVDFLENRPPVIALLGAREITLDQGEDATDPGATADDREDGDLSSSVDSDWDTVVRADTPGTYTVTYQVTDSEGELGVAQQSIPIRKQLSVSELETSAKRHHRRGSDLS